MMYWTVALFAEARSLISFLQLKKQAHASKFQVFRNERHTLVISGTGSLNAAIATTYMLMLYPPNDGDLYVNLGVCGAVDHRLPIGEVVLCHKVTHQETLRSYYPDILLRHPFQECTLMTVSRPIHAADEPAWQSRVDVVDMEAAGCCEAASLFFSPHRVSIVKIISDHLQPDRLTPGNVSALISSPLHRIIDWLNEVESIFPTSMPLTASDLQILEVITQKLRLTVTMSHQLRQSVIAYKIRTHHPIEWLLDELPLIIATKQERKTCFEHLRNRLVHA